MPLNLPFLLLLGGNLLPLVGVAYFGWDVSALLILYWSENLIIGFFTVVKMLLLNPSFGAFHGLFFSTHFGGFCAGHGLFIATFLLGVEMDFLNDLSWPFFFVFLELFVAVTGVLWSVAPSEWVLAFVAIALSHGVAFHARFLNGDERDTTSTADLMLAPYGRLMVLHFAIVLGGFATIALDQPVIMLFLVVALKTAYDIREHLRASSSQYVVRF